MLDLLFQIVIFPLYAALEAIFLFLYRISAFNFGLTIFVISFLINIICLPLYINAEKLQNEEKEIQKKLEKRVKSIKKNFKGDERHLILSAYYRQNNYHPVMALRTSLSLLLQIPFFTAAYFFFNNLTLLKGLSFGIIQDLSQPDALLHLGNLSINILPVLMTVINLAAGIIYAKNQSLKDKIQIWGIALIFLVILYNSPSGLVLYWTFNNLFSLIKNIGLKSANPKMFLQIVISIFLFALIIFIIKNLYIDKSLILYLLIIPAILFKFLRGKNLKLSKKFDYDFNAKSLYFLSCICMFILIGAAIPLNVIASSPIEFFAIIQNKNPLVLIGLNFIRSFGVFIFWGACLYYFSSQRLKKWLPIISVTTLLYFLINMFTLNYQKSSMSNEFVYDLMSTTKPDTFSISLRFILILFAITVPIILFINNKKSILKNILTVIIIALTGLCAVNISVIFKVFNSYTKSSNSDNVFQKKVYSFSKDKKNVLIIMIDRAISSYLPIIFRERPELQTIYSGFTYYPNTISFYGHTILAYPTLMGGYEYTPLNMNKRPTEKMVKKHDESLLLMPLLFKNNNWNATVTDAPWGNYKELTPAEMFRNKHIKYEAVTKEVGSIYKVKYLKFKNNNSNIIKRNLFYYSLMQVLPQSFKKFVYDNGKYLNANYKRIKFNSSYLIDNYAGLFYLPELTDFTSDKSSFIVINNGLTHAESFLTYPSYCLTDKPFAGKPLNTDDYSKKHYHVNAAALIMIGEYINYLKQNNVYDNTRIIIVSDHGWANVHNPELDPFIDEHIINYNPILLVKDFNSKGVFKTDKTFMTNAEVPYIAIKDIIKNPINPFTGKKLINRNVKSAYILLGHEKWSPDHFNTYTPLNRNSSFWYVKDDIFKQKNWTKNIMYSEIAEQKNKNILKKSQRNSYPNDFL